MKSLREAANAIEMEVVYFLVPKNESLEKTIHDRAIQLATEIVTRTSHSMLLEDQENSKARIEKAIRDMAMEIINSMPKYLWD